MDFIPINKVLTLYNCLFSLPVKRFSLAELSQMLQDPLDFVSEALEMLTWSFEFHKSHLFGKYTSDHEVK